MLVSRFSLVAGLATGAMVKNEAGSSKRGANHDASFKGALFGRKEFAEPLASPAKR
jgi:hypothetical protein